MTRMLQVVDDVLEAASRERSRSDAELTSVKEAAAQPRTQLARDLRSLGAALIDDDKLSYSDLGGSL